MQQKVLLIVVEGPSRAGRAEIAERIAASPESTELQIVRVPAPESDPALTDCFGALQQATEPPTSVAPEVLATIRVALRRHQIEMLVRPSLSAGRTVIVDGYWWGASVAASLQRSQHRGYLEQITKLEALNWQDLRPDVIFVVVPQSDDPEMAGISGGCLAHFERIARQEAGSALVRSVFRDCHSDVLNAALQVRSQNHADNAEQLAFFADPAPPLPISPPDESESTPRLPPEVLPMIAIRTPLPKPSPVYDTYWRFAFRRQDIFMRRLRGEPPPWTTDPILAQHKFTNVYRASDRVSQYLISRVIYDGERDVADTIFRILLFKLFNKIETWKLLEERLGEISWRTYDFAHYDRVLSAAFSRGERIYSAAYIMPSVTVFRHERKHQNHLKLLEYMMGERLPQKVEKARTLRDLFLLLRNNPGIGDFLAYQFAIDINYSSVVEFDESSFVVPGPGARDGIKKCFPDPGGLSETDIIERVTERQDDEFRRLDLEFQRLGNRELKLIDCQNIFCEVDKYARLKHPEIKGLSGRTRIKQVYRANAQVMQYLYPEKWGINAAIKAMAARTALSAPPRRPRTMMPVEEQLGMLLDDECET